MPVGNFTEKPSLFGEILTHLSNLMRKEIDLARSEMGENLRRAGIALGLVALSAILAITALNLIAGAIVTALVASGLQPAVASLVVAGGGLVIAIALLAKGLRDLRRSSLAPKRAAERIKRDANALKEQLHA